MRSTIRPMISPPIAPPRTPEVVDVDAPSKKLPKKIPMNATTPSSGERIQRADMISSVSRRIRIASVMEFFPNCDPVGAVNVNSALELSQYKRKFLKM
jgi:hypothetical protein